MKIDRNLNLVIPIETEKHGKCYVHSTSINREIFEQFYLEIGKVFSQCFDSINESHMIFAAPQLAYPALKSISKKLGSWEGNGGVEFGLINEMVRLSNVLINTEKGWEIFPLDSAVKRDMINDDEKSEILSNLVFFIAISKVAPKDLRVSFLEMAGSLRAWVLTCLDCMAYQNSFLTLIKEESIGENKKVSSVVC